MQKMLLYTALCLATTALSPAHAQMPTRSVQPVQLALLPDSPLPFRPPLQGAAAAAIMANPCALKPAQDSSAPHPIRGCEPASPSPSVEAVEAPVPPLTVGQKGLLAISEFRDPGNVATMTGLSAATIILNAHTAYGPGFNGFARATRYTAAQDGTAVFFGTFLIPSVTHQDPRYRRMPHASVTHRTLHAVATSFVAQHDNGTRMPNYANLLTNPACAEISNLYVPGLNTNARATTLRIATGYATWPTNNLIAEFLPDVARHVHIHVVFVQQLMNQLSNEPGTLP